MAKEFSAESTSDLVTPGKGKSDLIGNVNLLGKAPMKYCLTSKSVRLVALVYVPLLIAVAVAVLIAPEYAASKIREPVEWMSKTWTGHEVQPAEPDGGV